MKIQLDYKLIIKQEKKTFLNEFFCIQLLKFMTSFLVTIVHTLHTTLNVCCWVAKDNPV